MRQKKLSRKDRNRVKNEMEKTDYETKRQIKLSGKEW